MIPPTECRRPETPPIKDNRFEAYASPKKFPVLVRDALAGLIVALISIPLGVGFSMASGLEPEQGIIAGAVAGILGGVFGGSKYQVYGPTAAFIPLISGIVMQYDVPFLILASVIAGVLITVMGLLKLGDYFSKVPFSVTVGFTIGIALSIILGQLPDALGSLHPTMSHTLEKIDLVSKLLAHPHLPALFLAIACFVVINCCYRISVFIPGPLIAIILAILLSRTFLNNQSIPLVVDKFGPIGEAFFKLTLPSLGHYSWWSYITPVLSIVFIASLESLLSARMADRLAGDKTPYNANQELIGQGIVNTIAPLLNGYPCTGAFARTATSIQAGATSPAASLFNGGFVIILMAFFAKYVSIIPMACVAGLLLYVAVNMVKREEVHTVIRQGTLHTCLMVYTALMTLLTDLFIAVSTATLFYYIISHGKKYYKVIMMTLPLCLVLNLLLISNAAVLPDVDPVQELIKGNERFYKAQQLHPHQTHQQLLALANEQHPFAVVVGCSDSRVPPEIIFDQGLGDIFDIRTAGHVIAPVALGSLEYAVVHLNVPLIMVLGHQHCGAVNAAVNHENPHNHVNNIIQSLAPAITRAKHQEGDPEENAAKANIQYVMEQIAADAPLERYIQSGQVKLIGAYYHTDTGKVEFIKLR